MNLVLLYGGRSGEHEISLLSAASVLKNLDCSKHAVIPVGIDKQGIWRRQDLASLQSGQSLTIAPNSPEVIILAGNGGKARLAYPGSTREAEQIDLVFPILHGPLCEDGSLQGLLEMAGVAYVGSGVLSSALGMDKEMAKQIFISAGIPVLAYQALRKHDWNKRRAELLQKLEQGELTLPLFIKPANMGSSVGVHKVKDWKSLGNAIDDAFRYDTKVLVEQGIPAREIEVSVIEEIDPAAAPFVSVAGEIIPSAKHEFYSYSAKYLDQNGAEFELPAELSPAQNSSLKSYARKAFQSLGCAGYARVDFLVHQETNSVYLNEINTIPGFTSISMFPKMLEASGMSYRETLSRLIELALRDFQARQALERNFSI